MRRGVDAPDWLRLPVHADRSFLYPSLLSTQTGSRIALVKIVVCSTHSVTKERSGLAQWPARSVQAGGVQVALQRSEHRDVERGTNGHGRIIFGEDSPAGRIGIIPGIIEDA